MPTNLAKLLTETASRHGDRSALKLDDSILTYDMLNEGATRVAGLLKERGLQPGDRVGIMLPNVPYFGAVYYGVLRAGGVVVPMNVLLKGREIGFYLSDSGARLMFAWHGFAESAQEGAADIRNRGDRRRAGRVRGPPRGRPAPTRRHRARGLGHGRDPLHLGYHGHAQGRRADSLQHARELPGRRHRAHAHLRAGRDLRRAAVVSLLRTDLLPERRGTGGRMPDDDPSLRTRQGAGDRSTGQGHAVRGSAHDVSRAAQLSRSDALRRLEPAHLRLRRLGDAGGGHARLRAGISTASSSRATGCPRPHRWRRSTIPSASASPDRSGHPSGASR